MPRTSRTPGSPARANLGPLRQGQRLDTAETESSPTQEQLKAHSTTQETQRAPPAQMQTPPEQMRANKAPPELNIPHKCRKCTKI
jgi:hypothetical protein